MVQADLKSKERILDTKDEVYLSLNFLVGYDLQRLGRYRDSVKKLESVLKDLPERPLTNIALQTAIGIGGSYNYLREYQTAFELCTETMAKHEELLTHEPHFCVLFYNIMGVALSGLQRPKEAIVWARKVLQGAQKLYGPGNSRTSMAMGSLAANYADLKDIQKACYWQEKCIRSLTDSLGNNHPDTIDAEERLMNHIALHKIDPLARKGIIGLRKAHLEKLSQHFGDKDWRTLQCRAWLAQDYFFSGSLKKAMRIQEELVDTMEREFGEDDERIIEGVSALARTRRWTKVRRAVYWWIPQSFLK
jgi:tetratricopeptide (TPR) repeat protein